MACTKKLDERTNKRIDKWRQNNMPHQFLSKLGAKLGAYSSLPSYSSSFKAPASIVFLDILLTRETYPNLQRAITYEIFFRIHKKVNQVIYSSLPINSLSFKSLALTVFEIFCWQDKKKMPKITKGHNSVGIFQIFFQKLIRLSTHHYKSIHQISWL